ncbi:hypothetical protein [Halocatena salina]|uniref:Uncharacterized protein n=1 Tax=Halocatena salina TaxID=2934340 RepID=A0A8U0A7K4_9EURY|nr:hypothetical protein [Halocatena salina]UPM44816.1 hypothetical protein MW046_15610 [Halocatena salina]
MSDYDHAHKARLDTDSTDSVGWPTMPSRPSSADTGPLSGRAWYREFREPVLTAAVYNLEQTIGN